MSFDVVIVGAGVIGLSLGLTLARNGAGRVAVLDRSGPGAGASGLAAGSATAKRWNPEDIWLGRRTQERLREISRQAGGALAYFPVGSLTLGGPEHAPHLERQLELMRAQGCPVEALTPAEVARRWPALSTDGTVMALFNPEDIALRPAELTMFLATLARAEGVEVLEHAPAERVRIAGGRVTGVEVAGTIIPARQAVLAAGWSSRRVAEASGLHLPLKPLRTQVSVMLLPCELMLPNLGDPVHGYYTVTRGRRSLLFGYGTQTSGLDPDAPRLARDLDEEEPALAGLRRRIPLLADCPVTGGWAGLPDGAPDGKPLLGAYPGVEGLFVSAGYVGYGVSRSLGAAEALAAMMQERPAPIDLSAYSPARFAAYRGEEFEIDFGTPWLVSPGRNR